ncbi:unnamed protein product (macronuclear) [Paramecium tetraurelia]|uniref:Uncharacterized protein n=1 Tax=Paramecium tetraurelia TaxID=5888 RepID=A0C151_PARTE|nr:uncharacterized protein GSPATT00033994001 [Paramecium tetraurelia]CAK64518.1 unnamed protein product [Paramecium tetraurelia]|eukprot:XP_001431916.1 hypothetical protein (macronuclear) [Paramecium tetraurelia strain d4-2]
MENEVEYSFIRLSRQHKTLRYSIKKFFLDHSVRNTEALYILSVSLIKWSRQKESAHIDLAEGNITTNKNQGDLKIFQLIKRQKETSKSNEPIRLWKEASKKNVKIQCHSNYYPKNWIITTINYAELNCS